MDGQAAISVKHNFETAHRLPFLQGKCENLHGHTWWVTVTLGRYDDSVNYGITENGISVDFGSVKKVVRGYVDEYLDHGVMLGIEDPLLNALIEDGTKLFIFGDMEKASFGSVKENQTNWWGGLPWPTVEAVACMLAEEFQETFDNLADEWGVRIWVDSVKVEEGPINSALWVPRLEGKYDE